MKDGVEICPAGFEQAVEIFDLIRSFPDELVPRSIGDIVQNIDRFSVAMADGELAGAVAWQILPEIGVPHEPSVELQSLAVKRAFQRRGVGTALVRAALDRVRPLHPAQIIVLTFTPEFFRTFGFAEVPKAGLMHKLYTGCINCTRYDSPFTCPEVPMALTLPPAARETRGAAPLR